MRLRIESLDLIGTDQHWDFSPGLNIITGPITTGKTSLLKLVRSVVGSVQTPMTREVRDHVTALRAGLVIGDEVFRVQRPLVTTASAKVEIAGEHESWRLPASEPDPTSEQTYANWLLERLGLPEIRVPVAPTKVESDRSPVSINDYLSYCYLKQDEIDSSVFGHTHPLKDIKRKYVFQILFGILTPRLTSLQDELREVVSELRRLQSSTAMLEQLLDDTAWEDRAQLEFDLSAARMRLREVEASPTVVQEEPRPGVETLRKAVTQLDLRSAELDEELRKERSSLEKLSSLASQLELQSSRLTRAIVAGQSLLDFDFVVCPRCGAALDSGRASSPDECYVCLQPPKQMVSREDLVQEQDRVTLQVLETRDLVQSREARIQELDTQLRNLREERLRRGDELDAAVSSFVSDSAERIQEQTAVRVRAREMVTRLEDYLKLYHRFDEANEAIGRLQVRKDQIEADLQDASVQRAQAEPRIHRLEEELQSILQRFGAPRFSDPPTAVISRDTLLPIIDGRRFDELSSQGLQVIVNVAHALAHQRTAIELNLPLPNLLLIDGVTKNVGHEGFDQERVLDIYNYLIGLSESMGDRLQVIVTDNDVPDIAQPYVRARFATEARLIPLT